MQHAETTLQCQKQNSLHSLKSCMSKLGLTGLYTRILFSLQQPLESLENQRPNHKCRTFLDFNLSLSTGSCPMPHEVCLGFSLPLLLLKNNNKKDSTLGNTLQEVLTVICTKMISSHTTMLEKKSHHLTIQGRTARMTANHRILAHSWDKLIGCIHYGKVYIHLLYIKDSKC